jgi:hypothetical protein
MVFQSSEACRQDAQKSQKELPFLSLLRLFGAIPSSTRRPGQIDPENCPEPVLRAAMGVLPVLGNALRD